VKVEVFFQGLHLTCSISCVTLMFGARAGGCLDVQQQLFSNFGAGNKNM
jgi:hypothetical protein